jgi:hypothetical protein
MLFDVINIYKVIFGAAVDAPAASDGGPASLAGERHGG